ncbi:MAG: hypothetical protein ACRC37_06480 [Lentisphaeria bacterium]
MNNFYVYIILLTIIFSGCKSRENEENCRINLVTDSSGTIVGATFLPSNLSSIPISKSYENEIIIPYEMGRITAEQALAKFQEYLFALYSLPPKKASLISYENCKYMFLDCALYFARLSKSPLEKEFWVDLDTYVLKNGKLEPENLFSLNSSLWENRYDRHLNFVYRRLFAEVKDSLQLLTTVRESDASICSREQIVQFFDNDYSIYEVINKIAKLSEPKAMALITELISEKKELLRTTLDRVDLQRIYRQLGHLLLIQYRLDEREFRVKEIRSYYLAEKRLLNGTANLAFEADLEFIKSLDLKRVAENLFLRSEEFYKNDIAATHLGKIFSVWNSEKVAATSELVKKLADYNFFNLCEFFQKNKRESQLDLSGLLDRSFFKDCWFLPKKSLDEAISLIGIGVEDLRQFDGSDYGFVNPVFISENELFSVVINIDLPNSYDFFYPFHLENKDSVASLSYCDVFVFVK